jgi:hypothetical protein
MGFVSRWLGYLLCAVGVHNWVHGPVTEDGGVYTRESRCAECPEVKIVGWIEWRH